MQRPGLGDAIIPILFWSAIGAVLWGVIIKLALF